MADELSSDMPGTEEFEGMDMDELGKELPIQGAEPKADKQGAEREPARSGEKAGEREAASAKLEPTASDSVKTLEAKLSLLENTISKLTRENRSYQALQSKMARLENELKARGAAPSPTLSPEQQAEAASREAAEKFLNEWFDKKAPGFMETQYGALIEPLRQQAFVGTVQQRCAEMGVPFGELNPIFGKLITADIALAKDGDPAANDRLEKILKNGDSSDLMLRAILERSKGLQAQGAQVQQAQAKAADKGGRALKPNGAKPITESKRSLADIEQMSTEEQERLFDEDPEAYEKLIPSQRR